MNLFYTPNRDVEVGDCFTFRHHRFGHINWSFLPLAHPLEDIGLSARLLRTRQLVPIRIETEGERLRMALVQSSELQLKKLPKVIVVDDADYPRQRDREEVLVNVRDF